VGSSRAPFYTENIGDKKMSDVRYTPINRNYTGKHKVYKPGETFPESEILSNKEIDLNGSEKITNESGRIVQQACEPRIKVVGGKENEKKPAKKTAKRNGIESKKDEK
jgi:hypothetical protein